MWIIDGLPRGSFIGQGEVGKHGTTERDALRPDDRPDPERPANQ